jgi:hypothetical protein
VSHEVLTSNNTIDERRNEMFLSVTQNKNLIHILPLNHCAPANLYTQYQHSLQCGPKDYSFIL